jgi:hypothetical protein
MTHNRISVVAIAVLLLAVAGCQDTSQPVAPDEAFAAASAPQDLAAWFPMASREVLALPGTVFADHDESIGKLVFGVQHTAAIPGVRAALGALGLPAAAYEIEVTAPIVHMSTLRDRFRPTIAGTQIHFGNYVCTMGFNVSHSAGRSFITNSHCTNTQGGTEGTQYYQPSSSIDPTVIATEADDPEYFRGGVCPRGKKCRYSDSARALYSSGIASERGFTARTSGANNGSLEVAEEARFTTTSQDNSTTNFPIGATVNKVGRTTGWTRGNITRTCVNTSVTGSQVMQLCQTFVSDPNGATVVSGGDSGSGVFQVKADGTTHLVGLLWGGSSDNKTFIFSPLAAVQQELGSVTATR